MRHSKGMRRVALRNSAVAVLSVVGGCLSSKLVKSESEGTVNVPYSSSEQVILTPTLSGSACKPGNNFMVVYDKRTRNPKYVVERLNRLGLECSDDEDAKAKKKHRKPFFAETAIDSEAFRSSSKDYTNVPYDRGHMAPAADFICSPDIRDATFTMANICPQAPFLNKGFWAKFEAWLRYQVTNGQCDEIIVITGPVYAPVYVNNEWVHINRTIGTFPKLVHVPTHFFKVVVCLKKGLNSQKSTTIVPIHGNNGSVEWWPSADTTYDAVISVGAFMVANNDSVDSKTPLAHTAVRLDQLEGLLGYQLVPDIINAKCRQKLDSVVPSARDLQFVLDGHNTNEPNNLLFTNGKTALLLPSPHLVSKTATPVAEPSKASGALIPARYSGVTIPFQSKNSVSGIGLVKMMHLCEQVDCNKPLFGK